MKIVIGCDEAAYKLKEILKKHIEGKGHEVIDIGVYDEEPSLYPDTAEKLCEEITNGNCERGLLSVSYTHLLKLEIYPLLVLHYRCKESTCELK